MRRFRVGQATKKDIQTINTRYIENDNVVFPPTTQMRCACYRNDERCAFNSAVFLKHLEATHVKTDDRSVECPKHTCIIKATMRCNRGKNSQLIHPSMYNRILDECGDCDIKSSNGTFVDPALKFFYNIPLMNNTNKRIKEGLANGTPCMGQYIKLKHGSKFVKENWEGYMVNTIKAHEIDYILCKKEKKTSESSEEYFKVKPEGSTCTVKLSQFKGLPLLKIFIIQLPINCNISTTGHKLQGKTLNSLVVNSWEYSVPHWIYVVLSRVRSLNCLVLNEKLDESRTYSANSQVIKWERNIKDKVEKKLLGIGGNKIMSNI